jgi:hypothetical protein
MASVLIACIFGFAIGANPSSNRHLPSCARDCLVLYNDTINDMHTTSCDFFSDYMMSSTGKCAVAGVSHTCEGDRIRPFVEHCKGMRCGQICITVVASVAEKRVPTRRKLLSSEETSSRKLHFETPTYQEVQDGIAVRNETLNNISYHNSGVPMCAIDCWEVRIASCTKYCIICLISLLSSLQEYRHDVWLPVGQEPGCDFFTDYYFGEEAICRDERSWLMPTCDSYYNERYITKCLQLGCTACTVNTTINNYCNKWSYIYESRDCQYYDQQCQELTTEGRSNQTLMEAAYCEADSPCAMFSSCIKDAQERTNCVSNYSKGVIKFDHMIQGG